MRVDFYQLGGSRIDEVVSQIAQKLLDSGERLLVVAADEGFLARLDRLLWDEGRETFIPHSIAGGADDPRQPVLLSTTPDPVNLARNMLIADGEWREAALNFNRAFYLFDTENIGAARTAWKHLSGKGAEPHNWTQQDGRWTKQG